MKPFTAWLARMGQAIWAQRIAIGVWAAIILVIVAVTSVDHANLAKAQAALESQDQAVLENEVASLAEKGTLAETLATTEDPNTDVTSPQNVKSILIRQRAAVALNRVVASGRLTLDQSLTALYQLRKDPDSTDTAPVVPVQTTATAGLADLAKKSDRNRDALVAHLSDGDPDVRSASGDALALAGGAATAQAIGKVLSDSAAQADALTSLSKFGKDAVPVLVPFLEDAKADPVFRQQVATVLGTVGDASAIPALETQVGGASPDPTLRRLCLISLAQIALATLPAPMKSATPPPAPSAASVALVRSAMSVLIATVANPNDDSLARAQAALALGRIATPDAIAALGGALGDLDLRVARAALSGIQSVGPAAVPALTAALKSHDETVRVAAATALGGIGDATALAAIPPALSDPSARVRRAAAESLGRSANPAAVPLLVKKLDDPDGFVAGAASNSLHLLGKSAIPALIAALDSSSPTADYYASQALQDMGSDAISPLQTASATGSESQKVWIAITLGQMHDASVEPTLKRLADASDPKVKWAASQALLRLGGDS